MRWQRSRKGCTGDAQDEIGGGKRKNMKCRSCGHRFAGEFYESCPECYSVNTEGTADEKYDGYR